jgi:hypothetical protein
MWLLFSPVPMKWRSETNINMYHILRIKYRLNNCICDFGVYRVGFAYIRSFLCCVENLFVFVLCLVCPMFPVSLECPLLVASLIFSNVYKHRRPLLISIRADIDIRHRNSFFIWVTRMIKACCFQLYNSIYSKCRSCVTWQ